MIDDETDASYVEVDGDTTTCAGPRAIKRNLATTLRAQDTREHSNSCHTISVYLILYSSYNINAP